MIKVMEKWRPSTGTTFRCLQCSRTFRLSAELPDNPWSSL